MRGTMMERNKASKDVILISNTFGTNFEIAKIGEQSHAMH